MTAICRTRSRIYYRDKITNEIWYFETKGTRVSRDKLEKTLKENNKSFLYITSITDGKQIKKQDMKLS